MRVMSGAWVSRARLQAADGAPMPTKQISSFFSARAAAMVIISVGVASAMVLSLGAGIDPKVLGPLFEHIGLDPGQETLPVAGDGIPGLIESIVPLVIAMGVRRIGAARHQRYSRDGPCRQDAGIGAARPEILHQLLDRHNGAFRGEHRFFLHAENALQEHIALTIRF